MSLDPLPGLIGQLGIGWLFAWAAWHKVRGFAAFQGVLASYRLLPARAIRPAAAGLLFAEAITGVGAMLGSTLALLVAITLLVLYGGAIGFNLLHDRVLADCGCGGQPQPLSWWLVGRNMILAGSAGLALLPVGERALTLLDGITVVACVLFAAALYATANSLHAARQHAQAWAR